MALLVLGLVACDGAKDPTGTEPTFAAIRDDILVPSCGFSTCHGGGTGGLTLDASSGREALVDVPSLAAAGEILVIAGDPDGSYLVKKLEGTDIVDAPMPPPFGGQDPAEIDQIRAWIAAGAP